MQVSATSYSIRIETPSNSIAHLNTPSSRRHTSASMQADQGPVQSKVTIEAEHCLQALPLDDASLSSEAAPVKAQQVNRHKSSGAQCRVVEQRKSEYTQECRDCNVVATVHTPVRQQLPSSCGLERLSIRVSCAYDRAEQVSPDISPAPMMAGSILTPSAAASPRSSMALAGCRPSSHGLSSLLSSVPQLPASMGPPGVTGSASNWRGSGMDFTEIMKQGRAEPSAWQNWQGAMSHACRSPDRPSAALARLNKPRPGPKLGAALARQLSGLAQRLSLDSTRRSNRPEPLTEQHQSGVGVAPLQSSLTDRGATQSPSSGLHAWAPGSPLCLSPRSGHPDTQPLHTSSSWFCSQAAATAATDPLLFPTISCTAAAAAAAAGQEIYPEHQSTTQWSNSQPAPCRAIEPTDQWLVRRPSAPASASAAAARMAFTAPSSPVLLPTATSPRALSNARTLRHSNTSELWRSQGQGTAPDTPPSGCAAVNSRFSMESSISSCHSQRCSLEVSSPRPSLQYDQQPHAGPSSPGMESGWHASGRAGATVGGSGAVEGWTVGAWAPAAGLSAAPEEVLYQTLLGQGGSGKVYKGLWRGAPVAVKVVRHDGPGQSRCSGALPTPCGVSPVATPTKVRTARNASLPGRMSSLGWAQQQQPAAANQLGRPKSTSLPRSIYASPTQPVSPSCHRGGSYAAVTVLPASSPAPEVTFAAVDEEVAFGLCLRHSNIVATYGAFQMHRHRAAGRPRTSWEAARSLSGTLASQASSTHSISSATQSPGDNHLPDQARPSIAADMVLETHMLMELCEAGSLRSVLDSGKLSSSSWHEVLLLTWEVSCAMKYLHDNHVVHGDLKAANIMLARSREPASMTHRFTAKVCDFGNAKLVEPSDTEQQGQATANPTAQQTTKLLAQTRAGDVVSDQDLLLSCQDPGLGDKLTVTRSFLGSQASISSSGQSKIGQLTTASHLAPELVSGATESCFATDVYAFGVTMYEIATGRRAYAKMRQADLLRVGSRASETLHVSALQLSTTLMVCHVPRTHAYAVLNCLIAV
ncbi:hypothetical protein QJQ45_001885 [Haematococcus lacustris]|nr:hypothetical protein QJQ45_001885 [Haematococcus lacustris]